MKITGTTRLYAIIGDPIAQVRSPEVHTGRFAASGVDAVLVRSQDALLREVKATARRGYGVALSEAEFGVTAVAAAIRAGNERPALGTVSIAGPSARITEKRAQELAPLVLRSASLLSNLWPLRVGSASNKHAQEHRAQGHRALAV